MGDKTSQLNVLGPVALTRAALPCSLSRRHCRLAVVSFRSCSYRNLIACRGQPAAVEKVSADVADKVFQLNVLGPIALTQAALPSPWHCRLVAVSFTIAALTEFWLHAGASQHAAVEEVSAEVADKMFQLNVLGPIALTRAALPFLLSRRHCRIVVVSSMAAVVPAPGQAIYSGTKLALHGYFSTLQSELNDRQAFGRPLQGDRQARCMKRIHSSAVCTVHMEPVKYKQTVADQGGPYPAHRVQSRPRGHSIQAA